MKTISDCSRACFLFVIIILSLVLMNTVSVIMLMRLNRKEQKLGMTADYELAGY